MKHQVRMGKEKQSRRIIISYHICKAKLSVEMAATGGGGGSSCSSTTSSSVDFNVLKPLRDMDMAHLK